jgi:hypothetical protein
MQWKVLDKSPDLHEKFHAAAVQFVIKPSFFLPDTAKSQLTASTPAINPKDNETNERLLR